MPSSGGVHFPLAARLSSCGFPLDKLDRDLSTVFVLDPSLRISYCNPAWDTFALANGGEKVTRTHVLGMECLEVVPEPLRMFYADAFAQVSQREQPWEHDYECSSPELYRLCHMRVLPLKNGFLLVENSLRIEEMHGCAGGAAVVTGSKYRDQNGFITMCAHCRRARRNDANQPHWDWVPSWVAQIPPNVSHGLCRNCRSFYFGP